MANINEIHSKIAAIAKAVKACQDGDTSLALRSITSRSDRRVMAQAGLDPVQWAKGLANAAVEQAQQVESLVGGETFPNWATLGPQDRFNLLARVDGGSAAAKDLAHAKACLRLAKAILVGLAD